MLRCFRAGVLALACRQDVVRPGMDTAFCLRWTKENRGKQLKNR